MEKRSLLLVADPNNVQEVLNNLQTVSRTTSPVTAIVLTYEDEVKEIIGIPVVTALNDAAEYICREWVDEAMLASEKPTDEMEQLAFQS